jgi:peptidoglycan/xylan/chitin deacetylase (PgdA/CDA1 family)
MTPPEWMLGPAAIAAAGAGLVIHGSTSARSSLWGPVHWRGPTNTGKIAVTFDDGPTPGATDDVLDVLKSLGVPATFFVIGRNAAASPGLLRRIDAEGHLIGNHSYDHSHYGFFRGRRYWEDQLERTSATVAGVIGKRPRLFRPPIGVRTWRVTRAVRRGGYSLVNWSRRGYDGVPTTAERVRERLVGRTVAGDIVLLHDGTEPGGERNPAATVEALPAIVASARDRGLSWVRLDELIGVEPYADLRRSDLF